MVGLHVRAAVVGPGMVRVGMSERAMFWLAIFCGMGLFVLALPWILNEPLR